MSDRVRHAWAVACFVAAGAGIVLLLVVTAHGRAGSLGMVTGSGEGDGMDPVSFTIAGNTVEPLSPAVTVPLNLKFTNARVFPLTLLDVTVIIRSVDAPQADDAHPCTIADFMVQQIPRSLDVSLPARSTRTLDGLGVSPTRWPRVGMLNRSVNQDGCKGSTVSLDYIASARQTR